MKNGLLIALLLIACAGLLACARGIRRSAIYEIPDGYRGHLAVIYEQKGEPPLSRGLTTETIHFGQDGIVRTASRLSKGWGLDMFFYVDREGHRIREIKREEIGFSFVRVGPFQGKVVTLFSFSVGSMTESAGVPKFEVWLTAREKKG